MPNPNGSNDSMDKVSEIHTILSRYTEDLRRELASRDLRIENLQREFATMTARAVAAEKTASDNEGWLTKIRMMLTEAELVRGTYVESVRALIEDVRRLEHVVATSRPDPTDARLAMEKRASASLHDEMVQARIERDQAVGLLRAMARVQDEARAFLYELPDADE